MSSKQEYQKMLDRVFGHGQVTAEGADDESNFVTGALSHFSTSRTFGFFAEQLERRLHRLNSAFARDPSRREVLGKIARLSLERNFDGRLAELAAYDYFSHFTQVEVERTVGVERTLASYLPNRKASSFDGELVELKGVHFDVKMFSDVLGTVLKNIKRRAMPLAGVSRIEVNYPYDHPYEIVTERFNAIVEGLRTAADAGRPIYQHGDLPLLRFRLIPDPPPRVVSTEHVYRPDRLLQEIRYFVLNHFDQVLLDEPNILLYVVHPWFNFLQSEFSGQAEFYREYCRRVFVELVADTTPLKTAVPNRAEGLEIPVADIAKRFGAIMFLEDRTVEMPPDFDPRNPLDAVRGRLFLNPNANRANSGAEVWPELQRRAIDRGIRLEVIQI
jgi:hypothetical protein